jgi:hypothetical protein
MQKWSQIRFFLHFFLKLQIAIARHPRNYGRGLGGVGDGLLGGHGV